MDFKDKLIYIRAKLNLTQSELAEKLGVSYPTISRWELGKVMPTRKAMVVFTNFCLENNIKFKDGKDNE